MEYCLLKRTLTIVLATSLLCLVQTDNFSITHLEPPGTLYKVVGERQDLECSFFKDDTYNLSDGLFIQRCRNRACVTLPSEITNRTSIRSSIERLLVQHGQTYTCTFKHQPETMSITYVKVGYRPSPPKDVYCFSRDHLDMNCTVTLADRDAKSKLGHNVTIKFQSTRSTNWLECPDYNALYNYCHWRALPSSGIDLDNDFVINRGYIIRVTVENNLGSNQFELPIRDTSTIVTISNLHQFEVTNITSRKAVLTWALPDDLLPVTFVIDFEINYTSKWDPKKQMKYSSKRQMRTVMKDLIPNTKYDVSIRARGRLVKDERSWSPVNTVSFKTKTDAPNAAPRYTEGGFFLSRSDTNNTGDNCALQIYLKPVPRKQRNGDLSDMDYRVTLEGETNTKYKVFDPVTTLTLSHRSCWRDGPYRVIVQACIEGRLCSRKRSDIYIPSLNEDRDPEIPRATEVIVEGLGDTHFKVSWSTAPYVKASLVRQVTIFWCRGKREQHVCKSNLSWMIIKEYVTNADIEVKHSNYRDWIFAVSLTTHNGESGGMAFADCQFLYDQTQSQERTAVASLKPTYNLLRGAEGNDMKSRDIISLTFRYCDVQFLYRKPEQYEIFYKKASADSEEDCIKGAHSLNVTASLSLKEIVLPDLDPMVQYSVCMRIRTSVGTSELSDVKWREPLKHPGGVNVGLVVGPSAGAVVFLAAVVFFAVLFWRCRKSYKKQDVTIEVPYVSTYHQSTVETSRERKASDEDSGFSSQYVNPNLIEEKNRSMQHRTAPPKSHSEGSFVDINKMSGSQHSQVSGNNSRTGVTTKRLTESEPDCNHTGTRTNKTCFSTSYASDDTCNKNKSSCADCYWIASGFHDRDSKDEKEPFMKTDEFSKALSLIPTDLQSSKDANSREVMDRPSYSYKQQLDMGIILSVGDPENEACNYSDHINSTLYSDLSQDDFDQIAPLEDLYPEETVATHENNSLTRVKSSDLNQQYHGDYGRSQLRSNSGNSSERTSHQSFAMSLETSCTDASKYGTNTNPSDIEDDNSEEEHLLAYLQCDDKVEHTCSKPDNDLSINDSGTSCEPYKHHSGTNCDLDKHLSDTCCEPHKHHSGTSCEPYKHNSGPYCELDKDITDTCCEPHQDYSGSGCKLHKDHPGTYCEPGKDISDTCCEPLKDHPGTCSEPHSDQSDMCYEANGNNTLRTCGQHILYKTLDDKKKIKSKAYVKKIC